MDAFGLGHGMPTSCCGPIGLFGIDDLVIAAGTQAAQKAGEGLLQSIVGGIGDELHKAAYGQTEAEAAAMVHGTTGIAQKVAADAQARLDALNAQARAAPAAPKPANKWGIKMAQRMPSSMTAPTTPPAIEPDARGGRPYEAPAAMSTTTKALIALGVVGVAVVAYKATKKGRRR